MSEPTDTPEGGVIRDRPLLDLTSARSEEDLAHIEKLIDVATVLIPESLSAALTKIEMVRVAAVIPVPDDVRGARVLTGHVKMSGEALAGPNLAGQVLVVTGSLVFTSPVTEARCGGIVSTGSVLAPRGSESALGGVFTRVTGSVNYFPYTEGQQIKDVSGQTRLRGEFFANPAGTPSDILLVTGQVVVSSPIEKVGFEQVVVAGQLIVPRESELVLTPALNVLGQVLWYEGAPPRIFIGNETFSRAFFELLEPTGLALIGDVVIEPDVTLDLVREKITNIVLIGNIRAPKSVIPILQVLATEKFGTIEPLDDDAG